MATKTLNLRKYLQKSSHQNPVSILYKSIAGRYRPVRVADGPITARYRFIKNAGWEAVRGMKLKLSRNDHKISLYKNCVFIAVAHTLSSLCQLKSFHKPIMG